jgi:catechol 2,3-dioxygenase-like lactoylglutathione lyase family enzyme
MARRISETIYFVGDMDEAVRFYTEQLGFTLEERHDWGFTTLSLEGKGCIGLMLSSAWERELPDTDDLPRPRIAIQTDDFAGELHRLRSTAIRMSSINGEKGGRQSLTFLDADDNPIFLWFDPEESMEESK